MARKQSSKRDASSSDKITDSRFANFESDPRFRLPSKSKTKTKVDKRFQHMFTSKDFTESAKVDRYGRKLKSDNKKKALKQLYQAEEEDEDDEEGEDDDVVREELRKAEVKDPARGGGFSASESDSDSDSGEESEEEPEPEVEEAADMQRFRNEQAEVPLGDVTNRIAIVNLDWDYIKSVDLFAMFSSFAPSGGRIERVSIYPSEFGKERMQREELEGPPKEIFKNDAKDDDDDSSDDSSDEEDSDDESDDEEVKKDLIEEGNDQDFDSDALRSYQLDRLRYYYAVMVCSDKSTAQAIYEATDGREYQTSSNFLDLRFVPDDVTFDDEPRDECDVVPAGYKPIEFVTDALQHSKVKLTWDMHPEEAARQETIKKAFTGSRADIAENDLNAYLASDSDGEDEEEVFEPEAAAEDEPKLSKKELARRKMREALGLSDDPAPKSSKSGPVGDMQITFTSALTEKADGKKKDDEEETTREKYIRKEKERKEKRRQKAKAARGDGEAEEEAAEEEDLGFDDPFFTSEPASKTTKSSIRKEERLKKREAREAEEAEKAAEKAQLELIMADDGNDGAPRLGHFDMNEIIKAEKKKNKKGKKGKKGIEDRGGLQEDFVMDVGGDKRFEALFEEHEYAVDPSNPKFTSTPSMKKLLEEGRKKRKAVDDDEVPDRRSQKAKKAKATKADDATDLVKSIKNKYRKDK
ncbi:uncharacterized protein E0L32_000501 [Thyridium curvatum]|uniref:Uncharacterized protein n=1 Tax=Thyridium curvatum TaxID=1093900 RepID=A0A507B2Y9_9PEZI|nr:uncharacterized protein E0L32_000501 [Thyridium curvatum]TPX14107.1 hypothetical protein E0L32_000501 [Thyridium curvatum]